MDLGARSLSVEVAYGLYSPITVWFETVTVSLVRRPVKSGTRVSRSAVGANGDGIRAHDPPRFCQHGGRGRRFGQL